MSGFHDSVMHCPVCGGAAEHELNCHTNETTIQCASCGYSSQTEIVSGDRGKMFWAETRRFPMNESGRVMREGERHSIPASHYQPNKQSRPE